MNEDIKKMVEEEKALILKEELSLPTMKKEMKSVRFLSDKISERLNNGLPVTWTAEPL